MNELAFDGTRWDCRDPPMCVPEREPLRGPLAGEISGAPAQPGEVGEYLELMQTLKLTQAGTSELAAGVMIPPGDWDLQANASLAFYCTGGQFHVEPVPTGMSVKPVDTLAGWLRLQPGEPVHGIQINSPRERALFRVTTMLAFHLIVEGAPPSEVGNQIFLWVTARRMR